MKYIRIVLLVLLLPLIMGATDHKFYVSITKIEYAKKSESLQIITEIFIDDLEDVLQQRYNPNVSLDTKRETEKEAAYIKEYILQKINIKLDGKPATLNYIGRKYDVDIVKSFIEITGVKKDVASIEIENKVLMDMFSEQQNIIHLKANGHRKSLMLDRDNPKGVLNFN